MSLFALLCNIIEFTEKKQCIFRLLLLLFYGCYFAKMLSQRKKGIQTDQIGKGKKGLVKFIEITMKIASLLVPTAEAACIFMDISALPTTIRYVGVVIGLIGAGIFICSVLTMRDSWRAGVSETDKTELITEGVYKISRNPAFLGFDLVYIGILLMFFNLILLLITVFAVLMFHLQIVKVEENFLVGAFGDEYLNYKSTVSRYFGRKFKK